MPEPTVRLELDRTLSHGNAVYWACFARDGRTLATASLDNSVKLWNVADGRHIGTLKGHGDGVVFVDFLKDGRIVTASLDKTLKVWSAAGVLQSTLSGHQQYLTCAAVSRQGALLASGAFDKQVLLWNADTGTAAATLAGHEAEVQTVAISVDAALVASGGNDYTLRLWNADSGTVRKVISAHTAAVETVCFSPDGKLIASGGADGYIRFWSLAGESVAEIDGRSRRVKSLEFSPDSRWLAAGCAEGIVRLWSVADRRELAAVSAHKNTVYGVAFDANRALLATAGFDRSIRLWKASVL